MLLFIELFLQFLQLFWPKLVRTLANGFRARLKINNEFNWPVGRHTRKLFWKDILVLTNDGNLRVSIQFFNGIGIFSVTNSCLATKGLEMKECDARVSNKTFAGIS